jgi:nucleoid-associated protein YgaU
MILPELEIVDPNNTQSTDGLSQKAPDRTEPEAELSLETATRTADKSIRVDDLPGKLAEDTEQAPKPSKRRNSKKQLEAPESNGQLEGLLAAFFADEHGKSQTGRITNRLLDDLFGDFEREEYLIKAEDTLESIAVRKLKERRLAPLIFAINRELLGNVENHHQVILVPGTVIQLPHFAEILRFRIHVIGDPTALFVYTQINSAVTDKNSSVAEPLTYTCRLGDTLTSIAARHPLLQNPVLWVLLAKVNKLPIEVDQHSKPVAKIKRGKTLILPTVCEIESFLSNYRDQHLLDLPANQKASEVIMTPPAVTPIPSRGRSRTTRSRRRTNAAPDEPNTSLGSNTVKASAVQPMHAPGRQEMPLSRVITQNDLGDENESLFLRLEVNHQNNWLPVIEYSVNSKSSGLKLYSISGAIRELPIRLPTRAARELAENDMSANASTYCKKFLSGVV